MAKLGLAPSGGKPWFSTGSTVLFLVAGLSFFYVAAEGSWYCGSAPETVRAICDGCYAGGIHTRAFKRSSSDIISLYKDPFLKKSNALNFLLPRSHTPSSLIKRGIRRSGFIGECCEKNCEIREMVFYCCAEKQREYASFFPEIFRNRIRHT
ncbi:uncharacterized protein [Apostichopus japonicus]|uniref:uncharacterized protein n=1 Tax=Stichopus japonicus TaxID=307972 RepID=UPI003AB40A0D